MKTKGVSIRLPQEMLDKLKRIASQEGRSINGQVLVFVRQNIENFEKKHGKIEGDISPEDNVKPQRK